jgi:hypothetical protein
MPLRSMTIGLCLMVALTAHATAGEWSRFEAPSSEYILDLPTGSFVRTSQTDGRGHLTLSESAGDAMIDVYSGNNVKGLRPSEFIEELSKSPRIADVSYRALGRTWFVISGHYVSESSDEGTLIYYAKFLFSADLRRFAAFEISYSVREKRRLDPVVERMEGTFRLVQ